MVRNIQVSDWVYLFPHSPGLSWRTSRNVSARSKATHSSEALRQPSLGSAGIRGHSLLQIWVRATTVGNAPRYDG